MSAVDSQCVPCCAKAMRCVYNLLTENIRCVCPRVLFSTFCNVHETEAPKRKYYHYKWAPNNLKLNLCTHTKTHTWLKQAFVSSLKNTLLITFLNSQYLFTFLLLVFLYFSVSSFRSFFQIFFFFCFFFPLTFSERSFDFDFCIWKTDPSLHLLFIYIFFLFSFRMWNLSINEIFLN